MKKVFVFLLILIRVGLVQAQTIDPANRFIGLGILFTNSDAVFEGEFISQQQSVLTADRKVYTIYEFKVARMIKGTMPSNGKMEIEVDGGYVFDPLNGMDIDNSIAAHGNGFVNSKKKLVFLTEPNTNGNWRLLENIGISDAANLEFSRNYYESQPYVTLTDLYNDLSIISGISLRPAHPNTGTGDSPQAQNSSENSNTVYQNRIKAYNEIMETKTKMQVSEAQNRTLSEDITLTIQNNITNGSFYEFDVYVKGSSNSTYLDNVPVEILYNPVVFGPNVASAMNVTVTPLGNFNNANYYPPSTFLIDNSSNVFKFLTSAGINSTHSQLTTTNQQMAHVKMKLSGCGNVNISLTNAVTAVNGCWYVANPTGTSINFYSNLYYSGNLSTAITTCSINIFDFTSPINGGTNATLTIRGSNFGSTRGNGQVKFRCMDNFGFPYMNKLDNMDYVSWNDTIIKIKMPSSIDTLNFGSGNAVFWTPGSGDFKVVNNNGDSAKSGYNLSASKFEVYYSITSDRTGTNATISRGQKLKRNLFKSVTATGGYVVRLDTSISNYPERVKCVKRAIKGWVCLTEVNIKLGTDTIFQGYGVNDKICNISMVNPQQMSSASFVAETRQNVVICPGSGSSPNLKIVNDFDIRINRGFAPSLYYNVTDSLLPAFKIDFLEIMYHEIGHGISLLHVRDSSSVMFYKTLGNIPTALPGLSRRTLIIYTSDVDGGLYSVSSSLTTLSGQCGVEDMVLLSSGSCGEVGIKELLDNHFNAVVFPNPTSNGQFKLTFDGITKISPTVQILDLMGNAVFSEQITNTIDSHYEYNFDVNNLSSGLYFLSISQNNIVSTFKLINQ